MAIIDYNGVHKFRGNNEPFFFFFFIFIVLLFSISKIIKILINNLKLFFINKKYFSKYTDKQILHTFERDLKPMGHNNLRGLSKH